MSKFKLTKIDEVRGQFNNIRYHHDSTSGYLNDWFINTSFGFRF